MPPKPSRALQLIAVSVAVVVALLLYALLPAGSAPGQRPDRVLVVKHAHTLSLLRNGQVEKSYTVSLGRNPVGAKTESGDHKTPEGIYSIDWRNAKSKFHLSLHISYPNAQDTIEAHRQGHEPGGDIMIHGLPNHLWWMGRFHRFVDWTDGCVAVTNREMDQFWRAIPDGTTIEIRR